MNAKKLVFNKNAMHTTQTFVRLELGTLIIRLSYDINHRGKNLLYISTFKTQNERKRIIFTRLVVWNNRTIKVSQFKCA